MTTLSEEAEDSVWHYVKSTKQTLMCFLFSFQIYLVFHFPSCMLLILPAFSVNSLVQVQIVFPGWRLKVDFVVRSSAEDSGNARSSRGSLVDAASSPQFGLKSKKGELEGKITSHKAI